MLTTNKFIWSKSTFFIILLFLLVLNLLISINKINNELKFTQNKIRKDYELILERCEKKAISLGFLLQKTTNNTEQSFLLRSYNLLNHKDGLYLSFMPTVESATNQWFFSLDPSTGIELYKKVHGLKGMTNILIAIDVNSLADELLENNQPKFYKIYLIKKEINNSFNKAFNYYFDQYILKHQPNLLQVFKYMTLSILSPTLMLFGWFVIYYKMKFKYKKFYKREYSDLLKQQNDFIEELKLQINKQSFEISSLNLKIEALIQTNLAIDFFAKDFVSSLIKYNKNSDQLKEQKVPLTGFFSAEELKDKPINILIEETLQYHSHAFVNDNHNIITTTSNNFLVPGNNIFGLKKVIIVSLQYLLACSPLGTNFRITIDGTKFESLNIEIMEQDTFVFLEDQKFANKLQTTQKFTDLFCVPWEKIIELSKNENFT